MKFVIKNNGHRTKAFKVFGGSEDVRPGEERTIDIEGDVTAEFIARMKADGVEMSPAGKAKASRPEAGEPKTAADVLAMADGTPFLSFKAEAAKLLGDKTLATKDEIVAALKAL